jgi:hypothetical protein
MVRHYESSDGIAQNSHPEILQTFARPITTPAEDEELSAMHVEQDGQHFEVCFALFKEPYKDFDIPVVIEMRHVQGRIRAVLVSLKEGTLH